MHLVTLPTGDRMTPVNLDNVNYMNGYTTEENGPETEIFFAGGDDLDSELACVIISADVADITAFIRETVGQVPDFSVWARKRAAKETVSA